MERTDGSMKVFFLMQERDRLYGAERAVQDLLVGLRDSGGCEPIMCFIRERRLRAGGAVAEAFRRAGIRIRIEPVGSVFSPLLIGRVAGALRSEGAAVLHTIGNKADFHGWLAARRNGIPQVATVHGWLLRKDFKERAYEWLDRQVLKRCRRVVVLSRFYHGMLAAAGIPESRLRLIPTGYPPHRFPPEDATAAFPPGFVVGFMGRFSEEKCPECAIHVMAELKKLVPDARMIMAGEGSLLGRIRRLARESGLEDDIEFPGYLSAEDFFPRIHALLCTSHIENLPVNIMDAMAWSRPVAAFRVGGIPDLVRDGENGLLESPECAAMLARRLAALAAEPETIRRMGRRGRELLREGFGLSGCVKKHLEMYREAAEEV